MSNQNPQNIETNINSNNYEVELNGFSNTLGFIREFYDALNINENDLKEYIQYPMLYNKLIRDLSKKMYNLNGLYSRTLDKMIASPSLDSILIPYDNGQKSINKTKELELLFDKKINHKLTTRDILSSCFKEGMYVGIFRNTKKINKDIQVPIGLVENLDRIEGLALDENVMIQPLDNDYVKFIGFMNGDYVCAFDMMYFDKFKYGGLIAEIKNYPLNFIKAYNDYKKDASKRWFILDQKTTIAIKYRASINEPYGRPLALSALNDMFFSENYTDSKRANLKENSGTIRWLKQPMGEKQGQCSLNNVQQREQYDNFKKAVFTNVNSSDNKIGQTTTLVLAPGTEVGKIESDKTFLQNTLTDENLKLISTDLGLSPTALNGQGQGASYSSLAVNLDLMLAEVFQLLEQVEWQYTKILNNYADLPLNKHIELHYLRTSMLNKDKEFSKAKELYTLAGGSRIYLYATGTGDYNTYMKLMEYEKLMDYDNKFQPHPTSYTLSDKAELPNEGGRPEKQDSELTDSGMTTKTYGSNQMDKPSSV